MFSGAQWPFVTPFAFAPVPEASAWQGLIEEKPVSTDSVHKLLEDAEALSSALDLWNFSAKPKNSSRPAPISLTNKK
jgi:hypothetical protein